MLFRILIVCASAWVADGWSAVPLYAESAPAVAYAELLTAITTKIGAWNVSQQSPCLSTTDKTCLGVADQAYWRGQELEGLADYAELLDTNGALTTASVEPLIRPMLFRTLDLLALEQRNLRVPQGRGWGTDRAKAAESFRPELPKFMPFAIHTAESLNGLISAVAFFERMHQLDDRAALLPRDYLDQARNAGLRITVPAPSRVTDLATVDWHDLAVLAQVYVHEVLDYWTQAPRFMERGRAAFFLYVDAPDAENLRGDKLGRRVDRMVVFNTSNEMARAALRAAAGAPPATARRYREAGEKALRFFEASLYRGGLGVASNYGVYLDDGFDRVCGRPFYRQFVATPLADEHACFIAFGEDYSHGGMTMNLPAWLARSSAGGAAEPPSLRDASSAYVDGWRERYRVTAPGREGFGLRKASDFRKRSTRRAAKIVWPEASTAGAEVSLLSLGVGWAEFAALDSELAQELWAWSKVVRARNGLGDGPYFLFHTRLLRAFAGQRAWGQPAPSARDEEPTTNTTVRRPS